MNDTIVVALISFVVTAIGSYLTYKNANKKNDVDLQASVDKRMDQLLASMEKRIEVLEGVVTGYDIRERRLMTIIRFLLSILTHTHPAEVEALRKDNPDLYL